MAEHWLNMQNYMRGTTKMLEDARNMTTVILSSNYLSCSSAALDSAHKLGQGSTPMPITGLDFSLSGL